MFLLCFVSDCIFCVRFVHFVALPFLFLLFPSVVFSALGIVVAFGDLAFFCWGLFFLAVLAFSFCPLNFFLFSFGGLALLVSFWFQFAHC